MIECIPAIDLMDGQAVRLEKGRFESKKVYPVQPVEHARKWERLGGKRLHLVDLDGAKTGKPQNLHVLEEIAKETSLQVDFGGGVREVGDVRRAFGAGAKWVNVGSVAVTQPNMFSAWMEEYGPEHFILAADVKGGKLAIAGWQRVQDTEPGKLIQSFLLQGLRYVLSTDISRDGMLQGVALELYKTMKAQYPGIELIASGGASSMDDIRSLDAAGIDAVVVGKALFEGHISLEELAAFMDKPE